MTGKIYQIFNFVKNMGLRYVAFRLWFEFKKKSGLLKRAFPISPGARKKTNLFDWRNNPAIFLFSEKEKLQFSKNKNAGLREEVQRMLQGEFLFFSSTWYKIGADYDWLTNPITNYTYSNEKHWTEIPDFDKAKGDIKYVWEKSRFSHLLKIIRDDYHNEQDHAEWVFAEIDHWITQNPINCGPNWRCSQEISLRTLNWTFALHYYKNHKALTEQRFQRIINVIYWQLHHVFQNIHFSRIAVRNNHAITETMMLYLSSILFPFFKEKQWSEKGKAWLEEEVAYQIYEDGTYLQHSMNYHRVVVQLLTLGITLAEKNKETFSTQFYQRVNKSLDFLVQCLQIENGNLPNYGNNDGALFFSLSSASFRDYRPQLNALNLALKNGSLYDDENSTEEAKWYGLEEQNSKKLEISGGKNYTSGGYYLWKENQSFSFLRCASYHDRPYQADNLHLDIWDRGQNVLRDGGTYKYNDKPDLLQHFWGTSGHNTVSLGQHNQMLKGGRFIWFFWPTLQSANTKTTEEYWEFCGSIEAFKQIGKDIIHTRRVRKFKNQSKWEIKDILAHHTKKPLVQHWHPNPDFIDKIIIEAMDETGNEIQLVKKIGWYSSMYGHKEEVPHYSFSTTGKQIITTITIL